MAGLNGQGKSRPIGIRSRNRPNRSESLYAIPAAFCMLSINPFTLNCISCMFLYWQVHFIATVAAYAVFPVDMPTSKGKLFSSTMISGATTCIQSEKCSYVTFRPDRTRQRWSFQGMEQTMTISLSPWKNYKGTLPVGHTGEYILMVFGTQRGRRWGWLTIQILQPHHKVNAVLLFRLDQC